MHQPQDEHDGVPVTKKQGVIVRPFLEGRRKEKARSASLRGGKKRRKKKGKDTIPRCLGDQAKRGK